MKDKIYDYYLKVCFLLIILFIVFSSMMLVVLPPFQGPDEQIHWATALQKSLFTGEIRRCSSIAGLADHLEMMKLPHNPNKKISTGHYDEEKIQEECDFVIAKYPAWAYPGVHLARLLIKGDDNNTLKATNIFFLSRMFSLFFMIISILGFYVLLKKHREKCVIGFLSFLTLTLSPIFLQQSVIITADLLINIYAILLVICFLFWGNLNWLIATLFLLTGSIVSFTKPIFLPASLALVISQIIIRKNPIQEFKKILKKPEFLVLIAVFFQVIFTCMMLQEVTTVDINPKATNIPRSNPTNQIQFIMDNPWKFFKTIGNVLRSDVSLLSNSLGWLDTYIINDYFWKYLFWISFIVDTILAAFIGIKRINYLKNEKLLLIKNIFMIGSSYCVIIISIIALYIRWTPVGATNVMGMQIRYFIPFYIILFFSVFDLFSLGSLVPYVKEELHHKIGEYFKYFLYIIIIVCLMYFSSTWVVDIVRRFY